MDHLWRKLGRQRLLRLLFQKAPAIVKHDCALWPPQDAVEIELTKLQRKLVACTICLQKGTDEEPAQYHRRVNRETRRVCQEYGWWSNIWWISALSWDRHILRDAAQQRRYWNE